LVDFKKDTWIYILIAAILALISIFTPVGTITASLSPYKDSSVWFSGSILYNADFDPEWFGAGAATIWTLAITCMSIAILLFYGIHNMKGMEFKWDWLFYVLIGIALIIFPILMLVYDLDSAQFGQMSVGFAPIGILISGILCIGAFALEKFGDRIGGAEA